MTRFARAKGSKASNERREEEATPWHVMRQQLAEQLGNYQAQSGADTSYNLKEILSNKANRQKDEVWSEFGETKSNLKNLTKLEKERNYNKNCDIKEIKLNNNFDTVAVSERGSIEVNVNSNKKLKVEAIEGYSSKEGKSKRKILLNSNAKSVQNDPTVTKVKSNGKTNSFKNIDNSVVKSRKVCTIKKTKNERSHGKNVFVETLIEQKDSLGGFQSSFPEQSKTKKNIGLSVECEKPITIKKKTKTRMKSKSTKVEKHENNLDESGKPHGNSTSPFNSLSNKQQPSESTKNCNIKSVKANNKPHSNLGNDDFYKNHCQKNNFAKYPHQKSFQTIIANGREIRVVQFQGFLVKKEDAEELKKLKKKLLAQQIPKEKLEHIMKLERRKAEKALTREKKKVCFQCRQFGHNFSDCPEVKDSDMMKTGMCFKCGSLEHSHFECKVQQHQEYRHAVCFVCKEQGHIARQCPLNSQGLYPKGGSCHLCGEVTHLRKDCPKAVEEKTSKSVTVDTLVDGTVEDIGSKTLQQKVNETKKKKVIKFK